MKKTIREAFIIVVISVVAGFTANALSPKGIPLFYDYSERFAVDTAKAVSQENKTEKKRTKEGYVKPVNITLEKAKELFDEGVVFIDGREAHEYAEGHISNSLNISYKDFKDLPEDRKKEIMKNIPKESRIVSYCGGGDCEISIDNAYEFAKLGYEDVYIFLGGMLEWQSQNYPVSR